MSQSTLFVISAAGFGQSVSWKDDGLKSPGFQMSFKVWLHALRLFTCVEGLCRKLSITWPRECSPRPRSLTGF